MTSDQNSNKYAGMSLTALIDELKKADGWVTIASYPPVYSDDNGGWQVETNKGETHPAEKLEDAIRDALQAYNKLP